RNPDMRASAPNLRIKSSFEFERRAHANARLDHRGADKVRRLLRCNQAGRRRNVTARHRTERADFFRIHRIVSHARPWCTCAKWSHFSRRFAPVQSPNRFARLASSGETAFADSTCDTHLKPAATASAAPGFARRRRGRHQPRVLTISAGLWGTRAES